MSRRETAETVISAMMIGAAVKPMSGRGASEAAVRKAVIGGCVRLAIMRERRKLAPDCGEPRVEAGCARVGSRGIPRGVERNRVKKRKRFVYARPRMNEG